MNSVINSLGSIRAILVEELHSDWSKELHESVVLSILNNLQWNCYQTHPNVSSRFLMNILAVLICAAP